VGCAAGTGPAGRGRPGLQSAPETVLSLAKTGARHRHWPSGALQKRADRCMGPAGIPATFRRVSGTPPRRGPLCRASGPPASWCRRASRPPPGSRCSWRRWTPPCRRPEYGVHPLRLNPPCGAMGEPKSIVTDSIFFVINERRTGDGPCRH